MKIYHWEDPIRLIVKVAFIGDEGNIKTAFNFAKDKAVTLHQGEPIPEDALLDVPTWLFDEMIKGFAELANEKGLKLESDLKREGKLEATEKHLEDMRRIVFKDFEPKS